MYEKGDILAPSGGLKRDTARGTDGSRVEKNPVASCTEGGLRGTCAAQPRADGFGTVICVQCGATICRLPPKSRGIDLRMAKLPEAWASQSDSFTLVSLQKRLSELLANVGCDEPLIM